MVRLAWLRQHGFWLTLFFLVTLAVLLRSIGFGQVPVSLYWDEMAIWNDARSIATTGLDLHGRSWFQPLFISYGDYKLPVYIWFVSFVSRFVDSAALAVRLPSFFGWREHGVRWRRVLAWSAGSENRLEAKTGLGYGCGYYRYALVDSLFDSWF
ncbi:hypothetical protein LRY65_04750 [Candidatus Woesebacteria bacterium]|nr:hypothetical protein [Candidatus Woesebacteria bacterium]